MRQYRAILLAGASTLVLAATNPATVLASDLPPRPAYLTKAPPPVRDRWTGWVEGGAAYLDGDPGVAGLNDPPFDVFPHRWGWEAAAGVDYRFGATGWSVSAQFRYGGNGSASASNNPIGIFLTGPFTTTPLPAVGTNSATRKEHRWVADFMVGRDLGLGQAMPNEVKFGVRVAQIRATTSGSASWSNVLPTCAVATSYCNLHRVDYNQTNEFLGVGPRIELDGSIPLAGGWSFKYMGGAAALYGRRKASQTIAITDTSPTFTTLVFGSGGPIAAASSNKGFVFNADAMAGLSYAITPSAALMVSYRFDGYWKALRGFDATGSVTNLDRFYHGPMLRLTITN